MIIYPLNILTWPVVLAIWALDSYLFAVSLRMLLELRAGRKNDSVFTTLRALVDDLPAFVGAWAARYRCRPCPNWLAWVVVLVVVVVVRQPLRIARGLGSITLASTAVRHGVGLRIARGLGSITLNRWQLTLTRELRIARGLGSITLERVARR